jgi:hypothetical protein
MRAHPVEDKPRITLPDMSGLAEVNWSQYLRILLFAIVGIGGVVGLGYLIVRYGGELPAAALSPPTATSTPTRTPRPTRQVTATAPATTEPTATATTSECLSWEEISLEDAGQELCGYGTVKRWFAAGDLPFVAIFTEEAGTFAIVDRTKDYPEINPGECIRAEGIVEVMSATRPFIDMAGTILECP